MVTVEPRLSGLFDYPDLSSGPVFFIIFFLYFFCLHCCLINIHIFDYPDSRLSGLFTEVPTSPDNRGSTASSSTTSHETIEEVVKFITNVAEDQALLLPGRVPGFK